MASETQRARRIVVLLVVAAAGCQSTTAHRGSGPPGSALDAALRQAPAICARSRPGTPYALPVSAGTAAAELVRTHVVPNPWAAMAPDTIVFACVSNQSSTADQGVFVSSSGVSTAIPPGSFTGCTTNRSPGSCALRYYGPSRSRSVNPVILAVLGVVVVAIIWYVRRRRRPPIGPRPAHHA